MKRGFTIIEILVVVSIIALLSSVLLTSFQEARAKARDAERLREVKEIQNALELYRAQYGLYPISVGWWRSSNPTEWDTLKNVLASYISLPNDPTLSGTPRATPGGYGYDYFSDTWAGSGLTPGQFYIIVFRLEKNISLGNDMFICGINNTNWDSADSRNVTWGACG